MSSSKNIRLQDIASTAKKRRLLGTEIYERCNLGLEGGVTLAMLQSRSCAINNDLGSNYSANDLIDLCGLRHAHKELYPDICCYCHQDNTQAPTFRVEPCKHLLHAQCVRQFHENRLRGYHLRGNHSFDPALDAYESYSKSAFEFEEPESVVLCPICHDPIHVTVENLYAYSRMPAEFQKVKRRQYHDDESEDESTYKKNRYV